MPAVLAALLLSAGPSASDAVRAADTALDRAVAAGDAAAFGDLLEDGAVFASARRLSRGRDAVVASWKPLLSPEGPKLRWAPDRAEVAASGDLAFTIGRWTLESRGEDGKPVRGAGEYVTVWRRTAGGAWRALLDAPLQPAAKLGEGLLRTPALSAASAAGDLEAALGTWTRGGDEGAYLLVRRRSGDAWTIAVDSAFAFVRPPPQRRAEQPPIPRRALARRRSPRYAPWMPRRRYLDLPGPWLVAHRGGSALAPENTFAAFDRAAALGADVLEIDVRRTLDGAVVVFHDERTERLTGEPGTIEARTRAQVQALDAAHGFSPDGGRSFPLRGTGVGVPTFAAALARYPRLRFNVDAKTEDAALAEALVRDVRAASAVERVCLGSFFDAQAERLGALLPEVCRYLPQGAATCHVMAAKSGAGGTGCPLGYDLADLPHRMSGMTIVDARVVSYFHGRGIPVHVWTVDDEAEMRSLLALGVDGIVTDRPDVLARVLGRG